MTQSSILLIYLGVKENKEIVPTRDYLQPPQPPKKEEISKKNSIRDIPTEESNTQDRIKSLEQENKKMK